MIDLLWTENKNVDLLQIFLGAIIYEHTFY